MRATGNLSGFVVGSHNVQNALPMTIQRYSLQNISQITRLVVVVCLHKNLVNASSLVSNLIAYCMGNDYIGPLITILMIKKKRSKEEKRTGSAALSGSTELINLISRSKSGSSTKIMGSFKCWYTMQHLRRTVGMI